MTPEERAHEIVCGPILFDAAGKDIVPLETRIANAIREEREQCAKIAEQIGNIDSKRPAYSVADEIAAAIREER